MLLVAFLVGLIKPSDIGLRTALVSASVPPAHLVAAMGISRTTQDSARICGALAGAGFMASFGMASAYVVIVGLYLAGMVLTLRSGGAKHVDSAGRSLPPPSSFPAAPAAPDATAAPLPRPASPWRTAARRCRRTACSCAR